MKERRTEASKKGRKDRSKAVGKEGEAVGNEKGRKEEKAYRQAGRPT